MASFLCSRLRQTTIREPRARTGKRGRDRENMAVFASKPKRADEIHCQHNGNARFVPKKSFTRCEAMRNRKAQLIDIMMGHAEKGEWKKMAKLFEDIEKRFHSVLDMRDYHRVVMSLAKAGDPFEAHRWLHRSMEAGFQPLAGAFSSIISSHGKQQSITQAMDVFEDMKLAGVKANTVTYNSIMDAWARAGDAGKVQNWMQAMLDEGFRPSVVSFCILLSACATVGLLEDLDVWFELSQELGVELNQITFDSVIRALARGGDAASAMKWAGIMFEQKVKPNLSLCMQLLTVMFKSNAVELVDTLIVGMRTVGVPPDGPFFSRCVMLGARGGHSIRAVRWADECAMAGFGLTFAAKHAAMVEAGLSLRMFGHDAPEQTDPSELERLETQRRGIQCIQAARSAAIGKRFSGTIKDFVPGQFGYITCDAINDIFQQDVFLGRHDNPEEFMKGQRVSFTLRMDDLRHRPRAVEVSAMRPRDA